jgi:HEPN domain-containing protein
LSTQLDLARRWLETARRDLLAARNCVDGPHFLPGIAACYCQQAGEKLVKAVPIVRGIEPMRSRDIDMLFDGLPSNDGLRPILAPSRFTPYAIAFRYPGEDRMPTPAPWSGKKSATGLPRSTQATSDDPSFVWSWSLTPRARAVSALKSPSRAAVTISSGYPPNSSAEM